MREGNTAENLFDDLVRHLFDLAQDSQQQHCASREHVKLFFTYITVTSDSPESVHLLRSSFAFSIKTQRNVKDQLLLRPVEIFDLYTTGATHHNIRGDRSVK